MSKRCGVVLDERYLKHVISQPSPENPARLHSLYESVRSEFNGNLAFFKPEEIEMKHLQAVHSTFYIDQLRDHITHADPYSYDRDTYLMEKSLITANLAAGGCLTLADHIVCDELDTGFALIRPPGHHAEPGRGMGFCILNNIGITAQYLLSAYNLKRILIIDFDAHHGNGTQEIFYESDEVMVVSVHQNSIFPFTGDATELGRDKGLGYTINVPVHSHFGDLEYTYLIGKLLQGIVEQFMPQIILVSAGYDGHKDDTISSTLLTTEWFGAITMMLKQYAAETCNNKLLFILEGGYNPVSLEASVLASIKSLIKPNTKRIGVLNSERAISLLKEHPLHQFWTIR